MSRIEQILLDLKNKDRKALIPYLMAGFPSPIQTVDIMHGLVQGGADIIELGVPFSDPMADGPVIQKAGEVALTQGVGSEQVLDFVRAFRKKNTRTPVVLMGYANPIECYNLKHGVHAFVQHAHDAGVDGILVVDYPPEECEEFASALRERQMDLIFLLAPTSTEKRMADVARIASGYVYYVSLKGVTGSGSLNTDEVKAMLPRIRKHVSIPVGVGFGIRDGQTAKAIGQVADAVVIGSRLLQLIEASASKEAVSVAQSFMAEIRSAMDA
jgi:tryptophan synthase alpha chain